MATHSIIIHSSKIQSPDYALLTKSFAYRNIVISNNTAGGFIFSTISRVNVTFEDFYINNVTFTGENPLIKISAGSAYPDTQGKQTSLIIRNGVLENMLEKHGPTLATKASAQNGLFVFSNGPTILQIYNLSVTNVVFTSIER